MNKLNRILVAAAAAVTLSFTLSARAGEPLYSPKAKALADSLRQVPGTTPDMIDRSVKAGSPKALALAESLRKVPSTGRNIDLAHARAQHSRPKTRALKWRGARTRSRSSRSRH